MSEPTHEGRGGRFRRRISAGRDRHRCPMPASTAALPVFLFLNAGIGHRVGPNRLYVTLARKLAEAGIDLAAVRLLRHRRQPRVTLADRSRRNGPSARQVRPWTSSASDSARAVSCLWVFAQGPTSASRWPCATSASAGAVLINASHDPCQPHTSAATRRPGRGHRRIITRADSRTGRAGCGSSPGEAI